MATEILKIPLYAGKVIVDFYPNSHMYKIDGRRIMGVTSLLNIKDKSGPLVWWAVDLYKKFLLANIETIQNDTTIDNLENIIFEGARQHTVKMKDAQDVGTKIHEWVEQYVKGQNPGMPEDNNVIIGVNAFLDWEKQHQVKFLSAERVVYSYIYDYVGKMDLEALIDGKRCLVDIKTGNGLYNAVRLQTAAYAQADFEESGKDYDGRWAIRLSKETEAEYKKRMADKGKTDYPKFQVFEAKYLDEQPGYMHRDFKAFLAAKDLYNWDKLTDEEFRA